MEAPHKRNQPLCMLALRNIHTLTCFTHGSYVMIKGYNERETEKREIK